MKFNCLVVDDEPIAQNILKGFIKDTPGLELLKVCNNAMEALQAIQEKEIDILFLDIEMPKINGLNFLRTLSNPPSTIITTAYRQFAIEGFELNVVDYLLKPFSFERFLKAVNRITHNRAFTPTGDSKGDKSFMYFRVDRKNVKVKYDEIIYIEGLSNYVKIYLKNKNLVVYHKLIDLENLLPDDQFARIHRSYIIAVDKIKAYGKDYVEIGDQQLSIGKSYRDEFFRNLK